MKKIFFTALFAVFKLNASGHHFGCMTNNQPDLDHDINTFAAKIQGLEHCLIRSEEQYAGYDNTIVILNVTPTYPQTGISWPPSSKIKPIMTSFSLQPSAADVILSPENLPYLKQYEPIGTRDTYTLNALLSNGIKAYFSGGAVLALPKKGATRTENVYLVNVDDECSQHVCNMNIKHVVRRSHHLCDDTAKNPHAREKLAESYLQEYATAKCVVTTSLTTAYACLAFQTPVLFINENNEDIRLVRTISKVSFLQGRYNFNLLEPTENPKNYLNYKISYLQNISYYLDRINGNNSPDQLTFDHVVGLGDCCMPKAQMNAYFSNVLNYSDAEKKKVTNGAYWFDWTRITDLPLFIRAIKNKLEGCCTDDMEIRDDGRVIPFDQYGIGYSHLFDQDKVTTHDYGNSRSLLTPDLLKQRLRDPEVVSKLKHIKEKTMEQLSCDKPTLYIAYYGQRMNMQQVTQENIRSLKNTIAMLRKGNKRFLLCIVTDKPNIHIHDEENIKFIQFSNPLPSYLVWLYQPVQEWVNLLNQFKYQR